MQPRISVVVPVYNSQEYLEKCLDSILNQSFNAFEIVLVNDGSTDDSLNIAQRYAEQDVRIKLTTQSNAGLAVARNQGVFNARGEFVTFVDSDDYIHPRALELLHDTATQTNSDIVICPYQLTTESGQVLVTSTPLNEPDPKIHFGTILAAKAPSMVCDKLIKRELFITNDIWFPAGLLHEDVPTTFRLFHFATRIATVDIPLYNWVRRGASLSQSISDKHVFDFFQGFLLARRFLEEHNLLEDYLAHFTRRVLHFSLGAIDRMEDHGGFNHNVWSHLINRWLKLSNLVSEQSLLALESFDREMHLNYFHRFPPSKDQSMSGLEIAELEQEVRHLQAMVGSPGFKRYLELAQKFEHWFPEQSMRRKAVRFLKQLRTS